MLIRVSWDGENKIVVRLEFPAEWGWPALEQAVKSLSRAARAEQELNLILDLTQTDKLPEGAPFRLRSALANSPVALGYVVVVATSPSVHNAFAALSDLDPTLAERVIPVRSIESARAVLSHPYSLRNMVSPANVERG